MGKIENKRQFDNEIQVLKVIKRLQNSKGFPRLLTHGLLEEHQLSYMVITKFDTDLELMYSYYKRKFPLQTILTIGLQMLELLEKFHSLGFIHNDMKPQNIMTKYGQNQVYLIDFGLTSNTMDQKKYKFRGTPFFASNSALLKQGNGPKDDIESLIYILIYFIYGNLPWTKDIPVLQDDVMSNLQIQNIISLRNPYNLCQDIDSEFTQMLDYLQNLSFKKKPNYKLVRSYFESMIQRYKYKLILDWSKLQGPPIDISNQDAIQMTKQQNSKCVKSKDQTQRQGGNNNNSQEIINNNRDRQNPRSSRDRNHSAIQLQRLEKGGTLMSKFNRQNNNNTFSNNLKPSIGKGVKSQKNNNKMLIDQEDSDYHIELQDNISEELFSEDNSKSKINMYSRACKDSRSFQMFIQPSELINIKTNNSEDDDLDECTNVNGVYSNNFQDNNIKLKANAHKRRSSLNVQSKVSRNKLI